MKKLAAVFLTLFFASTASAQVIVNGTTNARMDGLGVSNFQIDDDFNIFINPAQIQNYRNNVYGEMGTWASTDTLTTHPFGGVNNDRVLPWGGMNMDASYGQWGVYIGRPYSGSLNTAAGIIAANSTQTLTAPSANRFDLFYGLHGMPLAVYLSYADRSTETKSGGVTLTDSASEANLGVGGLVMDDKLDVAVNLGLPTFETNDGTTKIKSDAAVNVALLARYHGDLGGNARLLTTGEVILSDSSVKSLADSTGQTYVLNTALNANPNPSTLFVAGIGIVSASTDTKLKQTGTKSTTSSLAVPVNVGVEHQTFKALKTRLGLSKPIYNTAEVKTGGVKTTTVNDGSATMSLGLGWAIADNVMLDAVINQDVLFTGTYMVSGIPETLASKLSLTYRMK